MQFTRWYDKDSRLKFILGVLEKMNDETRRSICFELIQMLVAFKYPETDDFIELLGANCPENYNRWYDKDEFVHSAVEMLKYADTDEKKELVSEFLFSIIDVGDTEDNLFDERLQSSSPHKLVSPPDNIDENRE